MAGPHIVAVWNPTVFVESLLRWQEGRQVTQVPFPVASSGIAERFDNFGDGQFIRIESDPRRWSQCTADSDPIGVAARDE